MREWPVPHVVEEGGYPQLLDVVVVEAGLARDRLPNQARHVHRPDYVLEPAVHAPRIDQIGPRELVNPSQALDENRVNQLSLLLGDFDVAVDWVSNLCDIFQ